MPATIATNGHFSTRAFSGDLKTLLAFNCTDAAAVKDLAGFTIECHPPSGASYYLRNQLQFQDPSKHAQLAGEPANSTANAPIHKFRWMHYPAGVHGGTTPATGKTRYTVTPRFFGGKASMLPLDPKAAMQVEIDVAPFRKGRLRLGFTRGFVQSQAFVHHFGLQTLIRPKGNDLLFDTSTAAGTNPAGKSFTFLDEYTWSGSTAREAIFGILEEVTRNRSLKLSIFAYDLNEPDICAALLTLAARGQVRIILDNATLHHSASTPKPEDLFEQQFNAKAKGGSALLRGKFGRFSHDKILIVSDGTGAAQKVLTGSTNFSVTGLYVNSNHVVVFDDPAVAAEYQKVFEEAWSDKVSATKFTGSPLSAAPYAVSGAGLPKAEITFSPHAQPVADGILKGITDRIAAERSNGNVIGNVFFAVMDISGDTNPVYHALNAIHGNAEILSYGISDSPAGISLYKPGSDTGILVTGKPGKTQLPAPFDQLPPIPGHQIHHKFVICGFNGPDPVVYCGSSNLAAGGEHANGDNLLAIHDADVVTAFTLEALALVDHFQFLDKYAQAKNSGSGTATAKIPTGKATVKPQANKAGAAVEAGWFLQTNDAWTRGYFDPKDLHSRDRQLFA